MCAIAQPTTPPALVVLTKACLERKPSRRPSMAAVEATLGQWLASGRLEEMSAAEAQASLRCIVETDKAACKPAPLWRRALASLRGACFGRRP